MMNRLTETAWRNLDPWECCGQDHFCTRGCHDDGGCIKGCIVPKLYARLAAYEDTGLTPEEITNLHYDHQEFRRYVAENARLRTELAEQQRETASCDYLLGEADVGARVAGGEIKELRSRLELAERERDKAVEDITHDCDTCLHADCAWDKPPCETCIEGEVLSGIKRTDNWQWRGTEGKRDE